MEPTTLVKMNKKTFPNEYIFVFFAIQNIRYDEWISARLFIVKNEVATVRRDNISQK